MLTPPELSTEVIINCLHEHFGLESPGVVFLPIGADVNTAVYRVYAEKGTQYLLKLRRGGLDELSVAVPAFLHTHGVSAVMAPVASATGGFWVQAHGFAWVLYPYLQGRDAYEVPLSDAQWVTLGRSLRALHDAHLPLALSRQLPREDYSPQWRETVMGFDQQVGTQTDDDPVASRLVAWWVEKRPELLMMVERCGELAGVLRAGGAQLVLCHGDMHPGNVLLGTDGTLAIVDWDNLVLAPRERDLMCIGGSLGFVREGAHEVELFHQGYGRTSIDQVALAYYRYERIVADIAAFAMQIFGRRGSLEDRENGLRLLTAQFLPDHVVAAAHETYDRLMF